MYGLYEIPKYKIRALQTPSPDALDNRKMYLTLYKDIFVHIVGMETIYKLMTCFLDNLAFLADYHRPS